MARRHNDEGMLPWPKHLAEYDSTIGVMCRRGMLPARRWPARWVVRRCPRFGHDPRSTRPQRKDCAAMSDELPDELLNIARNTMTILRASS